MTIFILGALTAMVSAVLYQLYQVLKDLRITIQKTNKILDDTSEMTESVKTPVTTVSNLSMNLLSGKVFEKIFSGRGRKDNG